MRKIITDQKKWSWTSA